MVALSGTMVFSMPIFALPPSPKRCWSSKELPGITTIPEETAIEPGEAGKKWNDGSSSSQPLRREASPTVSCQTVGDHHKSSFLPEGMNLEPGWSHKIHRQGGCFNTDFTIELGSLDSLPAGENRSSLPPAWIPSFPALRIAGVDQPS